MLKLYVYDNIPGKGENKLLRLFTTESETDGKIFQKIPSAPFKKMVELVSSVDEADYILMPSDYIYYHLEYGDKTKSQYFVELDAFSESHNKKVIVFAYGDPSNKVPLKNSIVLRPSTYRSTLSDNEIVVPAFIEDLGAEYGVSPRHKKNNKPTIGFAGMVALPSLVNEIKYQIKMMLVTAQVLLGLKTRAETIGLYFRRRFVKKLTNTDKCATNFIIRNSFSAHEKTITMDPKVLRKEYIDVIKDSDLGLVIRGEGNYSLRFFEVLSMGRVPLFIDTDTPLPLEDEIDYDSFMLRVDHKDLNKLPAKIEEFWNGLSEEQFVAMQKKARTIFETKLRPDVFYKNLFEALEQRAKAGASQ